MASQSKSGTVGHVATFDLSAPSEDGEIVRYPDSLLFRAGNYEAKGYEMTPAELAAAVDAFTGPVENEIEHFKTSGHRTIFDGNLGHVESVRLSDDGTELRGTVAIPKWLDGIWKAPTKQVSAVWDRETKTLRRLGLVVKGHVEGAALFGGDAPAIAAAFSEATGTEIPPEALATFTARKTTPEDTAHWQMVHDGLAGLRPGVCSAAFGDTPKQRKGFKKAHDLSIEHGAKCGGGSAAMSDGHQCRCAARRETMTKRETLNAKLGARAAGFADVNLTDDQIDTLIAAFGETPAEAPAKDEAAAFAETPYAKAMRKELDDLKAARLADRQALDKKDAALAAEKATRLGHVVPANKAAFAEILLRLKADDHAAPAVVTFSHEGKEEKGGRVDALMAFMASQPKAHGAGPVLNAIEDGSLAGKFSAYFNGDTKPADVASVAKAQNDAYYGQPLATR